MTDYASEILAKNKMKIHLEIGNICYNNMNMQEGICDCLLAQQEETKQNIDYEVDLSDNFHFYLSEIIVPITSNKNDMDTNSTSKFLFYHFNNLRLNLNEDAYKVRHTIVLDDQYMLDVLHSRDWPYFIDRLLEVSKDDVTSLNLSGVNDSSQNNFKEMKIINDTIDDLTICKDYY